MKRDPWSGQTMARWRRRFVAALAGLALASVVAGEPAAPPTPDPQARRIIDRWIDAIGGARKIARLRTQYCDCELDFGPDGPKMKLLVRATAAGHYRYDYETPRFGRLTQAFDLYRTWQRNDELGFGPVSAADHQTNLQGIDFRAPLRAASIAGWKPLPDVTRAGRRCQVLQATEGDMAVRWFFDAETGLRTRIEVERAGTLTAAIDSSDFRRVPGSDHLEPYRIERQVGALHSVVTIHTLLYNEDVAQILFSVPSAAQEENLEIEKILRYNQQGMGQAALQQVRSRVTRETMEITTSGVKIASKRYNLRPDLVLVEQDIPGMGKCWQGFDGRTGWALDELQGYREMRGVELQQMMGSADLDGPAKLAALCPMRKLLGEQQDKDRRLVGIALSTPAGHVGTAYFDTKTYDMVRLETIIQTGPQGELTVTADFGDFRKVDGIRMPFRTVLTNPAMTSITTVQSVEHNVALEPAFFAPRKEP